MEIKGPEVELTKVPALASLADGYEWKGKVTRSTEVVRPGEVLEITRFSCGILPSQPIGPNTICRMEYRLMVPNNRVFLVHYLEVDPSGAVKGDKGASPPPVMTVRPEAVNSLQFGQSMAPQSIPQTMMYPRPLPTAYPARPPMPAAQPQSRPPARPPVLPASKPIPLTVPTPQQTQQHQQQQAPQRHRIDEIPTLPIDDFDGITQADLAFERLKFQKTVMAKLFCPSINPVKGVELPGEMVEVIEAQLAGIQKEISFLGSVHDSYVEKDEKKRRMLNDLFDQLNSAQSEQVYKHNCNP